LVYEATLVESHILITLIFIRVRITLSKDVTGSFYTWPGGSVSALLSAFGNIFLQVIWAVARIVLYLPTFFVLTISRALPVVNAITEFESDWSRSTKGHFRTSTANGFFLFPHLFLLSDTSGFH
jgi:hypothetical protein